MEVVAVVGGGNYEEDGPSMLVVTMLTTAMFSRKHGGYRMQMHGTSKMQMPAWLS